MSDQFEGRIRDHLAHHLELLEAGLSLVEVEHRLSSPDGAGGRVDILAKDKFGHYVIIEIKRSNAAARQTLNEIHKYTALFRSGYGLDRDVRVMVVSTEWHELLVPFSECVKSFQCPLEGFHVEASPDGIVQRVKRVTPLPRMSDVGFSREHVVYLFEQAASRDGAAAGLAEAVRRTGVRDFIVIALDYRGERPSVIYPFGLYLAFSSPMLDLSDEQASALKAELEWDEELDCPDENFLVALNRYFQDERSSVETGYPEKLSTVLQKWHVSRLHRYGRLAQKGTPRTDDELLALAQAVRGGSSIYLHRVCSPRFDRDWVTLREDLDAVLLGLPTWQSVVRMFLDEIESADLGATVSVSIFNPADLVLGLYTIVNEKELSRCPTFTIVVESSHSRSTRICSGALAWSGTKVEGSADSILSRVYGGMKDWMVLRHMGSAWEAEADALAAHHLIELVVEFHVDESVEVGPQRLEVHESELHRTPFKPHEYRSLTEFAASNVEYLESLRRLVSSHSWGLDGRAGEGHPRRPAPPSAG